MPAGHPQLEDDEPDSRGPAEARAHDAMTRSPQSGAREDPTVPPRTIIVEALDGQGHGVPGVDITLGMIKQVIGKDEARQRFTGQTGADGRTTFGNLDVATSMAFRVSTVRDGATYAATPFQMALNAPGTRVTLYVYPVTRDLRATQVAAQGLVYVEIKDEVFQIEQAYRVYNLGTTTWLADNVAVDVPAGFKAFSGQQSMSDVAWDASTDQLALHFRGTIPPGQTETAYRFQVPNDGSDTFATEIGLLPNTQSVRVVVDAPKGMTMSVEGFPPAESTFNATGQRVLLTERVFSRADPTFRNLKLRLENLPTRPQGRWYALALALVAVATGVYFAAKLGAQRKRGGLSEGERAELERAKDMLLSEADALERARATGELGPNYYAAQRVQLVDALAAVIARLDAAPVRTSGDKFPTPSTGDNPAENPGV